MGTKDVPIGAYTEQLLDRADADFAHAFRDNVVSRETNVRLVRAKVELGEADAAIVYRTDATTSDQVRIVPIPDDIRIRAEYHIGRLVRAKPSGYARAFVTYVRSDAARVILERHGFGR